MKDSRALPFLHFATLESLRCFQENDKVDYKDTANNIATLVVAFFLIKKVSKDHINMLQHGTLK